MTKINISIKKIKMGFIFGLTGQAWSREHDNVQDQRRN